MHKTPSHSATNLKYSSNMCRSDDHVFGSHRPDPRLLSVTAFYLKLKLSSSTLHDNTLTLMFLPRINDYPLEVDGSTIRPDWPAYITLYRPANGDTVFGSAERIRVGEGARFQVYIGEDRLLKGVFRRGKNRKGWRVDCTCVLEREIVGLEEAEVYVAAEGGRMRERVAVTARRRKWRGGLEEIPEEEEGSDQWDDGMSSSTCSSSCGCETGSDGSEDWTAEMEYEMEGVRWAVDVGIWVLCLGVGYFVSRATAKTLRRKKILL